MLTSYLLKIIFTSRREPWSSDYGRRLVFQRKKLIFTSRPKRLLNRCPNDFSKWYPLESAKRWRGQTTSVTRFGYFWKVWQKILTKVAQIFGNFLGFALKYNFLKNTAVATFWSTFVDKNWLIFNSTSGHTANNNRRRRHSNRIQFLFRVRFCILNW